MEWGSTWVQLLVWSQFGFFPKDLICGTFFNIFSTFFFNIYLDFNSENVYYWIYEYFFPKLQWTYKNEKGHCNTG